MVTSHISSLIYNPHILVANTPLGKTILDECFFRTKSCCVDDGQYWFTDPSEFPIVEKCLAMFGIHYRFEGEN